MDKRCQRCCSTVPELRESKFGELCPFCYEHVPARASDDVIWLAAARVANYLERQLVRRIQNAVDAALERVKDNDL